MSITEIEAKSILRKHKKVDSWFISCYGMNLYRGCTHNCLYCDGRAEGYYVDGEFGEEVAVKVNAIDILRRELNPKRKRIPFKRGFVMVGGGVGDGYQPVEERYELTRQTLHLLHEHNFPVHILTKSTLVERDLDILKEINRKNRVLLSMSFSSADEELSRLLEPGVPSPSERLHTLARFKQEGFACGMFLMPVVPFLTDTAEVIENTLRKASEIGLDYVVFGGMTLKEGRQKEYFLNAVLQACPELEESYQMIYLGNKWGAATSQYYAALNQTFHHIASQYSIPKRIPARLFRDVLSENDLVTVILEQLDYLVKQKGQKTPYGYAAYSISQLKDPLSTMAGTLQTIKGVGKVTENIIKEILETGTSTYYEKML